MPGKGFYLLLIIAVILSGCAIQPAAPSIPHTGAPQPEFGIFPGSSRVGASRPEDMTLELAAGTLLTAESLPRLLKCTALGSMQDGVQVSFIYRPDQMVTFLRDGEVLAEGRWWMEGDLYCHNLGAGYGGRQCGTVVLNVGQLAWFDVDGYLSMQLQFMQR